ncbi:ubiquinone biosynthesis O-methyltransferase [Trichoderma ceciliae]
MAAPTRAVAGVTSSLRLRLAPHPLLQITVASTAPFAVPGRPRWHSASAFSSVNLNEVSHFNSLAAEWWDPHGSSRLLHLMNPLRHDFIRACLQSSDSAPRIDDRNADGTLTYLDIGCGGGIFAESAARLPSTKHVTAIDPTPSVLSVAKAHARKDPWLARKLSYNQCSVEQLDIPAEGEGYDIVTLFEVIEHIDDPGAFLDRVRPLVKPGGWLVMSTIARTWLSWLTTNLIAEDLLRIVPPGTHDWNKYINQEELRAFLAGKGWDSAKIHVMGVIYVPGLGWKEVKGSEKVGNYFFAVRKA